MSIGGVAYRDVGNEREQGRGSVAYRDVGNEREQGRGSVAYRDVGGTTPRMEEVERSRKPEPRAKQEARAENEAGAIAGGRGSDAARLPILTYPHVY